MAVTGGTTNGVQMTALIAAAGGDKVETKLAAGNVKCFSERLTLAAQAKSTTVGMAFIPSGAVPLYGVVCTDTSLATATFSAGPSSDADKYRADAGLTATHTPEIYGRSLAAAGIGDELTADEEVLFTISATAAFPGAGNLWNEMYYMTAQ